MSDPAREVLPTPDHDDTAVQSETEIYDRRFPDVERARRMAMWREIAGHLQRYIPEDSKVLDIGAGDGEFIANIRAAARWASDVRDTSGRLPAEVHFVQSDGLGLLDVLPAESFDRVFIRRFLPYTTKGRLPASPCSCGSTFGSHWASRRF